MGSYEMKEFYISCYQYTALCLQASTERVPTFCKYITSKMFTNYSNTFMYELL